MSKATDEQTALLATLNATVGEVATYVGTLTSGVDDAAVEANNATIATIQSTLQGFLPVASLAVTPSSLSVTVGQPITDTLTVSGGTEPYAASPTNGLSVSFSGATGTVSGDVATAGSSTFDVTDAAGGSVTVTVTAS